MAIGHGNGEATRSSEDLGRRAAQASAAFASLGIRAGDGIALLLHNDIAFFEASLAAGNLGAYAVPINWHFTGDEVGFVVRDCAARALVVHADLLPRVAAALPAGLTVLVVRTPRGVQEAYGLDPAACALPPDAVDWDQWIERFPVWAEPPQTAPHSMVYTSGTTGRPKGVRRVPPTPEQAAAVLEVARLVLGYEPPIRTVICGPLYHSAPNFCGLAAVRLGGDVLLQPRFDPEELLALIERHRISQLHLVPTMFVRLLRLPEETRRRYDLSSLRWVVHAAAPCPPDVKRAMIAWWGPILHEYYGSTESGHVVSCTSEEWLAHPGTVGRPLPNSRIAIIDDKGRACGPGEIGEVFCRCLSFADFTYQNQDAARREIERDGLISVGDVGYVDEEGYLYLCDRKRDMVISGGVNIYPAEIEAALIGMPGVHDCAVFGIPDDEMGERLLAAIEPQPGAEITQEMVLRFLRERIAAYKVPRRVEFYASLPREDSGKIFKRRLREPFWRDAGRLI